MADAAVGIRRLLAIEGSGYVANDAGAGPSRYGLTLRWLRSAGLADDPRALTRERAAEIYRRYWWAPMRLGAISDQGVADALLIAAVNIGRERAVRYWQAALGDVGERVRVDGRVGPETLGATERAGRRALPAFRARLERLYARLARQEAYAQFAPGWQRRLSVMFEETQEAA
jgi:lysozyme family protein